MSQSYWTAASETHQRESNTFIIQLNNRSVKDRSFSRKIESEWSFFIPLKIILILENPSSINGFISEVFSIK